jgi:hypothetical protein
MAATKKKIVTGDETSPEYDAGYNGFMRRIAGYCIAHAGEPWEAYWSAGLDDQPETKDYVEGWNEAAFRMRREIGVHSFGNARTETAQMKRLHEPQAFAKHVRETEGCGLKVTLTKTAKARQAACIKKNLAEAKAAGFKTWEAYIESRVAKFSA